MLIYNQRLIEIAIRQLISLFINLEYNNLYRYNKETNSNKKFLKIKEFTKRIKRAISRV